MIRARLLAMAATVLAACALTGQGNVPMAGNLLIRDVRMIGFSGEAPEIRESAFVLVRGGRIVAVRNREQGLTADKVTDAAGMTMIPGLTDMHVHLWDENELGAYLAAGVTRIRNMSGLPFHLELSERIEAGDVLGPHLITTGPILNSPGANEQLNHQIVITADEAREAVAWQADRGFRRLKIYSNLTREAYEAILEEADARGLIVTGHTPEGVRASGVPQEKPFDIAFDEILDDHFETIEHIESIVWHGLRGRHDEQAARDLARRIADAGVPVTTTLLAHHNLWLVAQTGGAALTRAGTEMLNAVEQETEMDTHAFWARRDPAPIAADAAFYARVADIFREQGVVMVAGSDAGIFTNIPGQSLLEELALLTKSGWTPYEALRAATYTPSVVFATVGQDGCVEEGCVADFMLYDCDPLADIACTARPEAVVRGGLWLDAAKLAALREKSSLTDKERTLTNVIGGMAEYGVDVGKLSAPTEY